MIDGLRYAAFDDPDRFTTIKVLYPPPHKGDLWGVLAPLKGTTWGDQIPVVSGTALSHALHGAPSMLRKELGVPPVRRALRILHGERMCLEAQRAICDMAGPHCLPGSTQMPECYVPPAQDAAIQKAAAPVAAAWDEGRYVFLVKGPEFVVT